MQDRICVELGINGLREGLSFTYTDAMIPSGMRIWCFMACNNATDGS